jgi:hypothetical protein
MDLAQAIFSIFGLGIFLFALLMLADFIYDMM